MAYPLIILGAGASYDSIDIEQYSGTNKKAELDRYKPPLTNQLFSHSRELFQNLLTKYSRVNSLAGEVLPRLADGKTFEEILQSLLDSHKEGTENRQERVVKELISLNYYLSDLLFEISNNFFEGDNNYIRLVTEMHNNLIKSYVINFNYDLIFERSASKDLSDIDAYISGDVKILKVHGACNWVYEPVTVFGNTHSHAESFFADKADQYFNFFVGKKILIHKPTNYMEKAKGQFGEEVTHAFMPALALPLNKKSQEVCPKNHLDEFERNIESFDRVIIIGWRGTDDFIIKKLKEKLGDKKLTTFVIANKPNVHGSDEIKKVKEEIKKQYSGVPQLIMQDENIFLEGFSTFMKSHSKFSRVLEKTLPAIMS